MRQSWMKNILLFSTVMVFLASCAEKEFSKDEPLEPVQKPTLYISSQGNMLYALHPKTGDVTWKFYSQNGITTEPVAFGTYVFVNTPSHILRLNALDGTIVDTVIGLPDNTPGGPITGDANVLYIPTNPSDASKPKVLQKFDHVKKENIAWALNTPATSSILTSPVIFGKNILVAYNDQMRLVSTEDANSLVWSINEGADTNPLTDGVNIFTTNGNQLRAYSFETGARLWTYDAPEVINTSPILYGGNILFGCNDSKVYCIDSISHTPRWTFQTQERVFSAPYAYDQTIYIGSNDHFFYAININDGSLKWKFRLGALILSSPIAYDGMVYIGAYDQNMYAFDTTGQLKWKYLLNGLIDRSPVLYDPDISRGVYPAMSGLSTQ